MTLIDRFLERCRTTPDADALRLVDGGRPEQKRRVVPVSYRALEARARALGEALLVRRLEPGTRVAILARPRLEWVALDIACQMAGLISVPLFPNDAAPAHARILKASDARLAIAEDPWQAKKLVEAAGPELDILLVDPSLTVATGARLGAAELGMSALGTLAELEARRGAREANELTQRIGQVDADAVVTLAYTPGTEGQAKGVMLTHGNFAGVVNAVAPSLIALARTPGDDKKKVEVVQLLTLPIAQALGRVALWIGLGGGIPTGLPRSDATLFEDAGLIAPTFAFAVPSFLLQTRADVLREVKDGGGLGGLLSRWVGAEPPDAEASIFERMGREVGVRLVRGRLQKKLGGRCRYIVVSGAALPDGLAEFYARHGLALRQGYGMVETTALSHLDTRPILPGDSSTPTPTIGKPLDGVVHRIGADGELMLKGPGLSPGYWRDPEETRKVMAADGFFHTGDLARDDGQGGLEITGRKRDIIVLVDGRTLAPRPIEDALQLGDPAGIVAQVLVHGERRAFVSALVGLEPDALGRFASEHGLGPGDFESWSRHARVHAHIEGLVARVNATLPAHAAIRKFAVLPTPLSTEAGELTPTRMLRRVAASEKFKPILDSFYAESF
ncbi:MAG: AMP-binding protein [Deltaproteobacteria bacterium]|nr:AMP-binding protein [Deltaproteobacteria bacterium]